MKKLTALFSAMIFFQHISFSQTDKVETDRSYFTYGANTLMQRSAQFETGLLRQAENVSNPYKYLFLTHPVILSRYGLFNNLELRLLTEITSIKSESVNNNTRFQTGLNKFQPGFKWHIIRQQKWFPDISIAAHYSLNRLKTLSKDSVNGAELRVIMVKNPITPLSIKTNAGLRWKWITKKPDFFYSISTAVDIAENWNLFAEYASFAPGKKYSNNSFSFGMGFWKNSNLKFDALFGFGTTNNAPRNFYGMGASFRLQSK